MNDLTATIARRGIETVADRAAGNVDAILNELLQNARKAGATRIDIRTVNEHVIVTDDGHGIIDPEAVLTYGQTAWKKDALRKESAGIGLFALANHHVMITTQPAAGDAADIPEPWQVVLIPEMFRGLLPAVPEKAQRPPEPHGTRVSFNAQGVKTWAIHELSRYFPVPVISMDTRFSVNRS